MLSLMNRLVIQGDCLEVMRGMAAESVSGSGTTGIAAVMEGFPFMGIEQDESYCAIARARIEYAAKQQLQEAA